MTSFGQVMQWMNWTTAIDIVVVFSLIFASLYLIKTTKSKQLIVSIIGIGCLYTVSQFLELQILNWILEKFATVLLILVIIIFQPELRRASERIRKGRLWGTPHHDIIKSPSIIKSILNAVETLSEQKTGALIVLECNTPLTEYIESGVKIKGILSDDLLIGLFCPKSPTHDGAVILHNDTIIAAGCLLPLSNSKIIDHRLGTRHIAGIGLSEVTDALIIIVSEETGIISMAENGSITRYLDKKALEARLFNLYKESMPKTQRSLLDKN